MSDDDRERAYRRALRWYPARWRDAHGDALIGDLMDQDDARGRRRPGGRDRIALAWQGLRRRSGLLLVVLSGAAALGALLTAFAAIAPFSIVDVFSLHPSPGTSDQRWIRIVGGVLVGAGTSALLLELTRGRLHLAGRAVTLGLLGAMAWQAGSFLKEDHGPGMKGRAFFLVSDGVLPIGWDGAVRSVFAPALSCAGTSTIGVCVLALLLSFLDERRAHVRSPRSPRARAGARMTVAVRTSSSRRRRGGA